MAPIAELKAALEEAARERRAANDKFYAAERALRDGHLAASGLAIGDTVESKGKLYRITAAEVWTFREDQPSTISLRGVAQLKSGQFGTGERYIGTEWKKVEATQ